jgi:hypothetical protein
VHLNQSVRDVRGPIRSSSAVGDCYQTLGNGSLAAPPPGLRSAAALGGLGTGAFSLHADGSFREWTVEHARVSTATAINKTAGNPARVFLLGDAFAGLRVSGGGGEEPFACAFRTQPPSGVPAADGMAYASASPVTRLQLRDARLAGVSAALYAHYRWKMGDSNASATPAVTFTLQLTNRRQGPINASLLLSMPLAANEGYSREGPSANATATGCGAPINPGGCRSIQTSPVSPRSAFRWRSYMGVLGFQGPAAGPAAGGAAHRRARTGRLPEAVYRRLDLVDVGRHRRGVRAAGREAAAALAQADGRLHADAVGLGLRPDGRRALRPGGRLGRRPRGGLADAPPAGQLRRQRRHHAQSAEEWHGADHLRHGREPRRHLVHVCGRSRRGTGR